MIRLVIIAFLLLIPISASSDNQAQTNTQKGHQKSQSDNKGSEKSPVFIKVIPTEPTHAQAEQEKNDKNDKSFNEKAMVWFTGALTVATVILAFFTYRLWSATVKMSKDAKDTADRQASEMINSLALTKESLDLARKEFISTHRPKLIVRGITMKPHSHPSLPIEPGKPMIVEAVIINIGDSPAEIFNSNATILVGGRTFGARTPFGPAHDNFNGVKLAPGGAYTIVVTADKVHFENAGQYAPVRNGEKVIYFFGYMMYRDDLGNERRTTFCRRYDPNAERFILVDNSDYEHAD